MVTGAPNIRLQLGMFTLYPAVGTVPAGGSVQITVDMIAENPGFSEEVSLSLMHSAYDLLGDLTVFYVFG